MRLGRHFALIALLSSSALGCGLEPLQLTCEAAGTCDCPPSRVAPGVCCPAWSVATRDGECSLRPFVLPAPEDAMGEPAARNVKVIVDGNGRGLAAYWSASDAGSRVGVFEETAEHAWSERAPDAMLKGNGTSPELAAGANGGAVVVWADDSFVFSSERSSAGDWRDPAGMIDALSFWPKSYQPRVVERSGEWLLVWNQWMSTGYGVSVATRSSLKEAWKRPENADDVISPHLLFSNAPFPAMGPGGEALISWHQSVGGPLMAFASGRPSAEEPFARLEKGDYLSPPGAPIDSHGIANSKPAFAPSGAAAIAWTQENGAGATPVFLAVRDPGGSFRAPRDLADSFSRPVGVARCVQLAFGPNGDLYVIWYQDEGEGDTMFAARRRPDGTWAEDGRHPVRLSSGGTVAAAPALAVGPEGGVIAVWSEGSNKSPFRVAARRTGGAAEPWGAIEILSPSTGEDAADPAVGIGPGDRAMVGWTQGTLTGAQVMFARVE